MSRRHFLGKKEIMDWTNISDCTDALEIVKKVMIHVEKNMNEISGKEKSNEVKKILQDKIDNPCPDTAIPTNIRQHLQMLIWYSDSLLQPIMDSIVEAAKGKLPTRFSRSEDDAEYDAHLHNKTHGSSRVRTNIWQAYSLGY